MPPKFEAPSDFSPGTLEMEPAVVIFVRTQRRLRVSHHIKKTEKIYGFNYRCLLNNYCFKFLEKLPQNYKLPNQPPLDVNLMVHIVACIGCADKSTVVVWREGVKPVEFYINELVGSTITLISVSVMTARSVEANHEL